MNTETPIERITPTRDHAAKIVELLGHGLSSGLGKQEPGMMCVEAAVCFALGLPHGDDPKCVGSAVREFKITLNDCSWPSKEDRAEGMKRLAVAQLGSDTLDQMAFGKLMYLRGVQKILPFVWRKEADRMTNEKHKAEMIAYCEKMEEVKDFKAAEKLVKAASASAYAYAYASAYAYAYAYAYASTYAYASAYTYPSAYRHELLKLTAQVGLDVLVEMKSPGCEWLDLCD